MARKGANLKSAWVFRGGWRSGALDLLRPICMEPKNEPAIWQDWWFGSLVSYMATSAGASSTSATIRELRKLAGPSTDINSLVSIPITRRIRRIDGHHDRSKLFK